MKICKIRLIHCDNGLFISCRDKRILNAIEHSLRLAVLESNEEILKRHS